MEDPVSEILSKYALNHERAKQYVDAVVRKNQTEAAELVGWSRTTIQRYRNKFDEMSAQERAFLISQLMDEKCYTLYTQS